MIVVESNIMSLGEDSAVFTGSDAASDAGSEGGGGKGGLEDLDILLDEDETSILCRAVAFDKIRFRERSVIKLLPRHDRHA